MAQLATQQFPRKDIKDPHLLQHFAVYAAPMLIIATGFGHVALAQQAIDFESNELPGIPIVIESSIETAK